MLPRQLLLALAGFAALTGCRKDDSPAPNLPPEVVDYAASPPVLAPNGTAEARITVTDPEGAAMVFEWEADAGFTVTADGDDPSVAIITAPDAYGATGNAQQKGLGPDHARGPRASLGRAFLRLNGTANRPRPPLWGNRARGWLGSVVSEAPLAA